MAKQKSITINFIMNTLLTMSSFLFPLITFPYVSRILFETGTGKVSLATSVISYFTMVSQLGIPTYGVRAVAAVRDDREKLTKVTQELLLLNLLMSILSYVVLGVLIATVPRIREERTLYLVISSSILLSAIGVEWFYRGLEHYTYITVRSILFKFVALGAMFLLVHEEKDYVIYGGISILAASASNVLNFINIHKYIDLKPVGKYDFKPHMKPILVFFAMSCATTIYTNLDTVMLGFMKTDGDVGYYNAAVKIKNMVLSLVTSLSTVLLPRASYYVENDLMEEFWNITKKSLHFIVLIAAPVATYFVLYAREGILFLSGERFLPGVLAMQIIMPTVVFIGLTNVIGIQVMVPTGKEKLVLYSVIAGAVTDLVLNVFFIPTYAAAGAALGTLVAELVVLVVQVWMMRKELIGFLKKIPYLKIGVSTILGGVCSYWVIATTISSFWKLVISAICFFASYGTLLLMLKEELLWELLTSLKRKMHM